jgi:sugar O-acyltransferase (sialic acid O-acetyltransferase NeuD family)
MRNKLVIFGIGETAATIYEYFKNDSDFEIIGFTAHKKYISNSTLNELPIISFEDLLIKFDPKDIYLFPAISYTRLNKDREEVFNLVKTNGFKIPSFISSKSFISPSAKIGEGVFIYDNVSVNHNCVIYENTVIGSGSVISHSTKIGKNTFIAPNSSIGGFVSIGNNCFIGIGCTIIDKINITDKVILSAGSVLLSSANNSNIYKGNPAKDTKLNSEQFLLLNGEIS